jgi:glycosyltransferase involved in cell wall biosynthesis
MADNLARGLARQKDCELYFCASENFRMWVNARRYLRRDPELAHVPLLSFRMAARLYGLIGSVFWRLAAQRDIVFPLRAVRRLLSDFLLQVDRRYSPLRAQDVQGKHIFHSQFFPLPAATEGVPGLRRFLSVCDLINIQHPQFSEDGGAYLKSVLATLTTDDWVIAISESTKRDLLAYRPDLKPEKVWVVHLAASEHFHPVAVAPPARPYFLSVCTLDRRKNMEGLVRAFALWVQTSKVENVDLLLCGSLGESADTVRDLIRTFDLGENRVRLLGYVPDDQLAPLYSGALAFVYPSFYEGFGLPVLEAMQCGVPVITSTGSSLEEVASGAARLVNPADVNQLSQALQDLYSQPQLRQSLREQGLERAKCFSWAQATERLMAAYRHAVKTA